MGCPVQGSFVQTELNPLISMIKDGHRGFRDGMAANLAVRMVVGIRKASI